MQKTTINPPQVRLVTMTKLSSSKAVVLSGWLCPMRQPQRTLWLL